MRSFLLHCRHLDRDVRSVIHHVPNVQIISGQPTHPGEVGCVEMHQEAVRQAAAAGEPYCAVYEDDCAFYPRFHSQRWETIARIAHELGHGAVHGGSVLAHGARIATTLKHPGDQGTYGYLLAVDKACSAHCMIYTSHGYAAVLNAGQPLDLSIAERGIRPLVVWPFVAYQRKGLSGIGAPTGPDKTHSTTFAGSHFVDYESLFVRQEQHLGQTLGLDQRRAS